MIGLSKSGRITSRLCTDYERLLAGFDTSTKLVDEGRNRRLLILLPSQRIVPWRPDDRRRSPPCLLVSC